MTLKTTLFEVAKKIRPRQQRQIVKNLIRNLNESNPAETDRSSIGYFAKRRMQQFAGYLAIDDISATIGSTIPFKIIPLTTEERRILENVHSEIQRLIAACISPTLQDHPHLSHALFPYPSTLGPRLPCVVGAEIFTEDEISSICSSFNNTICIQRLRNLRMDQVRGIPEDQVADAVLKIDMEIMKSGIDSAPEELIQWSLSQISANSVPDLLGDLLNAVAARQVVNSICQMIYQAIVSDRLVMLDENNIIEFKFSSNVVGDALDIDCQPSFQEVMASPGDLVLVDESLWSEEDNRQKIIARVDHMTISFSKDLGNTIKFQLRKLDNDLNAYPGLVRHTI